MSKQSWKTGRYSLALFPDEKKYSSHLYLLLKAFGTFGYKSIRKSLTLLDPCSRPKLSFSRRFLSGTERNFMNFSRKISGRYEPGPREKNRLQESIMEVLFIVLSRRKVPEILWNRVVSNRLFERKNWIISVFFVRLCVYNPYRFSVLLGVLIHRFIPITSPFFLFSVVRNGARKQKNFSL